MNDNEPIVGKNGYELLKVNQVKKAILREAIIKDKSSIFDNCDEYKSICQKLNVKQIAPN